MYVTMDGINVDSLSKYLFLKVVNIFLIFDYKKLRICSSLSASTSGFEQKRRDLLLDRASDFP